MAHEEDTPKQQSGQEKPVVRRDKVVVTKVTSQELSIIKRMQYNLLAIINGLTDVVV